MSTPAASALASTEAILALLGIPTHLCDRSDHGLHVSYQKYTKSFWHSHVKKYFSRVANHPLLVAWLENIPEDRPSDLEVWGMEKSSYTFKDLDAFLQQAAGKGKKKAKVEKKQKDGHKKAKKQVK